MKNWSESWPTWQDDGKRVELLLKDGAVISGTLFIEDVQFDGEDEFPIWRIKLDSGGDASFVDHEEWRFELRRTSPETAPQASNAAQLREP